MDRLCQSVALSDSDLDGSSYLNLVERLENGSVVPRCRTWRLQNGWGIRLCRALRDQMPFSGQKLCWIKHLSGMECR